MNSKFKEELEKLRILNEQKTKDYDSLKSTNDVRKKKN